jgi:dTDP-4-amino-4,6-dideoxygalactose transaminase
MRKQIHVGDFKTGKEEKRAVNEVLSSGRLSEGHKTREFEQKWAKFVGTKYCVATSSGAGALITALTALKYLYKLENRSKVITTPLTYIADANALSVVGFEPVFVDIDPIRFCITPEAIEEHLKNASNPNDYSIILPVDLMGYSAELDEIKEIAKKYNLIVLEDAAQAHGTIYQGKKAGSNADLGIFSFYIAHNIQAGEMGAITTNSYDIYRLSKKIKTQGRACECSLCTRDKGYCPLLRNYKESDDFDPRFSHDLIGYNFKITEFQTALALAQLKKIDWIIQKRRENVQYLNKSLACFSDLLQLPLYLPEISYLAYPIVIRKPEIISRKKLRDQLERKGIETRPLFGCIPTQQTAYSHLRERYIEKLPNAEYIGLNGFYVGCHQYLSQKDLDYIVFCFKDILEKGING